MQVKISATKQLYLQFKSLRSGINFYFFFYYIWQLCILIARGYFFVFEPEVVKTAQDEFDAQVDPSHKNVFYYNFVNMNSNNIFILGNTLFVAIVYPIFQTLYHVYFRFDFYKYLRNFLIVQIIIYIVFSISMVAYFGFKTYFIYSIASISVFLKTMLAIKNR